MYYITYNTSDRAGAGAQVQRILSLFLLSQKYNLGYVHNGFITDEHGFSQEILDGFNHLIELYDYNKRDFDEIIHMNHFNGEVLSLVQNEPKKDKDILIVIPGAHFHIDSNPSLLDDLFPVKFSWIDENLNPETQVAIHIRRGYDVTKTVNADRFVDASVYFEYIKELRKVLTTKPYKIHIFSKKEIAEELQAIDIDSDIVLHIEEDVIETFKFLVNCDILFAGRSSFSYSAAMLRRKGVVLYNPFWHGYPEKHVCLNSPEDIHTHREKILRNI